MHDTADTSSILLADGTDWLGDNAWYDFCVLSETERSIVYKAARQGRYYAIKTLCSNDAARNRQLLEREFALLQSLDSEYIVRSVSLEDIPEVGLSLVMMYINGRTLDKFMQENPPARLRNKVFEELLCALDYVHKQKIVHQDLKPSNIIITCNGNNVRLIDFGFSDADDFVTGRRLGATQRYASPELLSGSETVDHRSDIYSLGCLMRYDLFHKRYAHISKRCTETSKQHRYGDIGQVQKAFHRAQRMPYIASLALAVLVVIGTFVGILHYQHRQIGALQSSYHEQQLTEENMNHALVQELQATTPKADLLFNLIVECLRTNAHNGKFDMNCEGIEAYGIYTSEVLANHSSTTEYDMRFHSSFMAYISSNGNTLNQLLDSITTALYPPAEGED